MSNPPMSDREAIEQIVLEEIEGVSEEGKKLPHKSHVIKYIRAHMDLGLKEAAMIANHIFSEHRPELVKMGYCVAGDNAVAPGDEYLGFEEDHPFVSF